MHSALTSIDPEGARRAGATTNWRKDYVACFRRVVESGFESKFAAESIAQQGLAELHQRMVWTSPAEDDVPLADWVPHVGPEQGFSTEIVSGCRPAEQVLGVPLRGRLLRGADLSAQLEAWVTAGVMEPSAAESIGEVMAHPEWLSLPGRTVVCVGAGAELSPVEPLLQWGASVAAIDLPGEQRWARLRTIAERSAGQLALPVRADGYGDAAGADLLTDLPALIDWAATLGTGLVVGNYTYADGGTNVALAAACDVFSLRLRDRVGDLTLAFLATPTDVFVVPQEAVEASVSAHASRSLLSRAGRGFAGGLSRQALLRANYPASTAGAQIHDALVPQQGPNYALAKRIQRWRATSERAAGRAVSINVAPPTRTHSVMKNRSLAAAYSGAGLFNVEVFEPATTRFLMAALLVHDLCVEPPVWEHPWQAEADQAVHGGLWRTAYSPRSALGLAAVAGLPRSLLQSSRRP